MRHKLKSFINFAFSNDFLKKIIYILIIIILFSIIFIEGLDIDIDIDGNLDVTNRQYDQEVKLFPF